MDRYSSLLAFVTQEFPDINKDELLADNEFDERTQKFDCFLNNTLICKKNEVTSSRVLSSICNKADITHQNYYEFVDNLVSEVRSLDRSAICGLFDVSLSGSFTSNPFSNFQVHVLKDENWARLCEKLGRLRFAYLLICSSCFVYHAKTNTYINLYGTQTHLRKKAKEFIFKTKMFYRWRWNHDSVCLLQGTPQQIGSTIFDIDFERKNNPKKFKRFLDLILVAKRNEEKIDYSYIFANIVKKRVSHESVFDNSSSFKDVLRFTFSVTDLIFPKAMFGCKYNMNVIRERVRKTLRAQRLEAIEQRSLMLHLKLNTITWLGKKRTIDSIQDKKCREEMLSKFLKWYFNSFLVLLIKSFWYVTDVISDSTQSGLACAFFPHRTWNRLSGEWLNSYISRYLHEVSGQDHSKYNHGILRLIPKKNDFRPLCTPWQSRTSSENERQAYDRDIIRPVRDILREQQKKIDANKAFRCFSVRDICRHISEFKRTLSELHDGHIPPLFGIKFDMKHCYDNLNQAKIIECIENLFSAEEEQEIYYVRTYSCNSEASTYGKSFRTISKRRGISNFNLFENAPNSFAGRNFFKDQCRTTCFTKSEILDIVKDQVLNSTIEIPQRRNKIFTRKEGVFQGLPLSATFCEIVYNHLVDHVFFPSPTQESVLLRLADDFLFLSTKMAECEHVLSLATSKASSEYGAYVNQEKCCAIGGDVDFVNFVGLEIDIKSLSYRRKTLVALKLPTNTSRSLKAILAYLEWSFNARLSDHLLDTYMVPKHAIVDNVRDVLEPVLTGAQKYLPSNIKELKDEIRRFEVFITSIVRRIIFKVQEQNDDHELVTLVCSMCAQVIGEKLTAINTTSILEDLMSSLNDTK
ncbi:putative telomerase reverse transcriptase [Clavispora lusitaniae]|uniref:Telomerase reverse transcriptase n=1 Tax=Clavispora lusitaniae TaxID=36911 RepID=A0ACD0WRX9_CLALS|nr:putative telomerase reverse transcriptase [Clavispora lusitaniae]QFZ35767.1 putative telomerase reverse transcriptase [Clavispora lusitaniae]QFZ41449.1 putative telomerase reverse transcriptase [Clavispora lusitaniae]QFZ47127.1 putative telomerase reverse transcriptase [Clavispora lusitaniae]QFZ52804.1 putative telomerase reverse transcriptase [Clavispora lusitaniae]